MNDDNNRLTSGVSLGAGCALNKWVYSNSSWFWSNFSCGWSLLSSGEFVAKDSGTVGSIFCNFGKPKSH